MTLLLCILKKKRYCFRRLYICRYFSAKRNYTTKRTFKLIEELEGFDAETYILSHGTAINRAEFLQEIHLLKTVGTYTETFKGDREKIKAAYKQEIDRELNEDELETIEYFVNGYEMVKR